MFRASVREFLLQLLDNFTIVCGRVNYGNQKKSLWIAFLSTMVGWTSSSTYTCPLPCRKSTASIPPFKNAQRGGNLSSSKTWVLLYKKIHGAHRHNTLLVDVSPTKNLFNTAYNIVHRPTLKGKEVCEPPKLSTKYGRTLKYPLRTSRG